MDIEIPELDNKGLRKFAYSVGIAIGVIFGAALPFLFDFEYPIWPWIVASVLVIWGTIAPASLALVYKGWMTGAIAIGKVTTPIVLGVVFVLLIAPIGLFMRLFRRRLIETEFNFSNTSYKDPAEIRTENDMERPF